MKFSYPRIDWRGDGPGYAEMEFPIIPWSTAVLYKIFGYHPIIGRWLIWFISLMTMLVFFMLSRYWLPTWGAFAADFFFILSPLAVRVSNSLQPEGLMLFFYMLAAYAFVRWLDEDRWLWYAISLVATASAVLVKIPTLHIGIFFLLLLISRKKAKSLRQGRIWAFGVFAVLPGVLWYLHAHHFWIVYGNSLGVSNEYHWMGWDLLKDPLVFLKYILRQVKTEVLYVWTPLGGIVSLAALLYRKRDRLIRFSLFWLISLGIYYLVTIRTTADSWAAYYHVVSIPPAALLIGAAMEFARERIRNGRVIQIALGVSAALSLAIVLAKVLLNLTYKSFVLYSFLLLIFLAATTLLLFFIFKKPGGPLVPKETPGKRIQAGSAILVSCLLSVFPFQAMQISRDLHPHQYLAKYACAQSFKPLIPEGSLILASGGNSKDETGRPVASNIPYMFFWLDRKGFNVPVEQQSLGAVQGFMRRGARYFVLEREAARAKPGFKEELEKSFSLIAECEEAYLFRLF